MEKIYFEVHGIGRVHLVQECGANLVVEDESGTRMSLPASRCTVSDQTAAALADQFTGRDASIAACDSALAEIDALADQFTGKDLGAEMAAAEGGGVQCLLCAQVNQCIEDDGEASEEVGVCSLTIQFRALHFTRICSDFKPLPIEPLRVDGYRVGDAHEGGEG
jgi:hypothetical protein